MKKKGTILLVTILSTVVLVGCGSKKISNDIVSISQYIGLDVSAPAEENDSQAVSEFATEIWEALLANCTVEEYPQEELKNLIEELETQYSYVAYYDNKSASELIEEIHGMTVEELAKEQLKKKYAVELIAEEEDLKLSTEEYNKALKERATSNGIDDAKEYENMFGYEELYEKFLEERVIEFLISNLKE